MRSHDLTISAIVCPLRRGVDVAENLEPRLAQIRETMALAFDLGPRLVIIPIGKLPVSPRPPGEESGVRESDDPAANVLREALLDLGKHGDRTGVTIALDSGVDGPESLVAYLDRFDVGSLGLNYNPASLVIAGHNPHDAVKTMNKKLIHAHAQDARRISPNRMGTVPLGHGDLDWLQLLANFEEIEYRGPLTVLGDGRAEIAAGVAFLRRFVA